MPHKFYHQFCIPCADFNFAKRTQNISIPDRIAFVTGIRAKIGYEIALKLLRSGCSVLGTTRFPKDAIRRYALEPDFEMWKDNLKIFPIDFRNLTAVGNLIDHLNETVPYIDILINNAAQTVRKPPEFYAHLMEGEKMDDDVTIANNTKSICHVDQVSKSLLSDVTNNSVSKYYFSNGSNGVSVSSLMSQIKLLPEEKESQEKYFPKGEYDFFGQQVDLRPV